MKSIDNLREWWRDRFPVMDRQLGCDFREHIDAIEREVEELRDRDYRNGREDAKGAVEFADRLCRASERREDVTLWGVDYTPLPVDADGVPIQLGDYLESDEYDGKQFPCRGLNVEVCTGGKRWTVCMSYDSYSGTSEYTSANRCHHVKPLTVEDVLREFSDELWNSYCIGGTASDSGVRELEAKYAARLRLVGEE